MVLENVSSPRQKHAVLASLLRRLVHLYNIRFERGNVAGPFFSDDRALLLEVLGEASPYGTSFRELVPDARQLCLAPWHPHVLEAVASR